MAIQVLINGIDRTKRIQAGSLRIDNVINSRTDTAKFSLLTNDITDAPAIGREVIVYNNSVKVFAGNIIRLVQNSQAYKLFKYDIECADYTRLLDKKLVPDAYEDMTIANIITDIKNNYMPAGFTTTNVNCDKTIEYIGFNYKPISRCLDGLAKLVAYDWYVDYDKDIHFFPKEQNTAPVVIEDDNGSHIYESLRIRKDNSQVVNKIFVRGGEYLGAVFTATIEADGYQATFNLPYRYSDFGASLTGRALNLGVDGLNDPNLFDALYNFQEKVLKFREERKPSPGATLSFFGKPWYPVRVSLKNQPAIDAMASAEGGDGIYEKLIIDNSINSREGARERALAELEQYKTTITEGEFETLTDGFRAGQQVTINSASRGMSSEKYIINRVASEQFSHNTLKYAVSLVSTKTLGIIEYLQKILLDETNKIVIDAQEVIDLVEDIDEGITLTETLVASISHNPQTEAITMDETFTAQSLNWPVRFVLGKWAPSGYKRQFLLNYSPGLE